MKKITSLILAILARRQRTANVIVNNLNESGNPDSFFCILWVRFRKITVCKSRQRE